MQPNHAATSGGKRLSAPSNPDCLLFTAATVVYNGEKQLELPIHGSISPLAANQMEQITS
jgi:hypothetical protein